MSRLAVAVRLARRDLLQAPGRALLSLTMVALPVFAVTAADVLLQSESVTDDTGVPSLGPSAEALLRDTGFRPVQQDATGSGYSSSGEPNTPALVSESELLAVLPAGSRLATVERGIADVALPDGPGRVRTLLAAPDDPLLDGRFTVTRGALPRAAGEIAVGPALVDTGLDVGTTTRDGQGKVLRVVGVLPAADRLDPLLLALPGTTTLTADSFPERRELLVDSPTPVTWQDVQKLNDLGFVVTSRSVLRNPPPDGEVFLPPSGPAVGVGLTIIALVTAMAVLQVVLLAGPAFAVGARRQRFSLAQLAAVGGRPRDGRRVVLAGAGLIGGVGAATGILGGVGLAALVRATVDEVGPSSAGLPVLDLVLVFAIAVASALLAALAPARSAARLNPITVLSQRPEPARPPRLPVALGVGLFVLGVLAAVDAARGGNETSVAAAAVPTVLGAVLLAPLALVVVARLLSRLPFFLRYPVRDAARQRARTAPAVGAVAAVIAAAVALGIGGASDAAQQRAIDDAARLGAGVTAITGDVPTQQVWDRIATAVADSAPELEVVNVLGLHESSTPVLVCPAGVSNCFGGGFLGGFGSTLGASVLVGGSALPALGAVGTDDQRREAAEVLAAGGVAVLTDSGARPEQVSVTVGTRTVQARAAVLDVVRGAAPAQAVVSEQVAAKLGLAPATTALALLGDLDGPTGDAVAAAVQLRAPEAFLATPQEASYDGDVQRTALLVLGAVAALLVLGGALTSTSLVLADARPEFVTLGTLGAASSTRRLLAFGYALTLALVGAVLGVLAGAVPGIAVAYPLTSNGGPISGLLPAYLDVPWLLLLTLVLGVPVLAGLVAAATARGGLPAQGRKAIG